MVVNIRDLQVKDDFIVSISGTVTSIREDEFILSDRTGQVLVDAAPGKGQIFGLNVGERVTVLGDLDDEDFDAIRITRPDGSLVSIQAGTKGGKGDFGGSKGGKGNFGGDLPGLNPVNPTPGVTTPIGNLQVKDDFIVSISGTVTSIREDEFILSDGTGQVLVDAAPGKGQIFGLNVGERVTVLGDLDDEDFDAIRITRPDGSLVSIQAGTKGGKGDFGGSKGGKGNFGGDLPGLNPVNPTPGVTTPIGNLQVKDDFIVSISGTVTSIREDEFILSDRTGQVLVDADLGKGQILPLTVGEQVTVVGDLDDEDFDAISITRANGSMIAGQPGGNQASSINLSIGSSPDGLVYILDANNNDVTLAPGFLASYRQGLHALDGNDRILGSLDGETINGNQGADSLIGAGGNDTLFGGKDSDFVDGGDGDDLLNGNIGQDLVLGGKGNDLIYGGKDRDSLVGGDGNDTLSGDLGVDTLTGGAGNDLFVLRWDDAGSDLTNVDTIVDFTPGDRIGLTGGLSLTNLSLQPFSNSGQNGTLIQVASTGEVLGYVANVAPTNLSGAFISLPPV